MKKLDFEKEIKPIGGWLTKNEANYLYKIGTNVNKNILEIGSWKGRSTICFALGLKSVNSDNKVYAVDPHLGSIEHVRKFGKVDTYKEFLVNISNLGLSEYIIPLRKKSVEAVDDIKGELDFILVDGSHIYKDVKDDYLIWFSRLSNNGKIGFHDYWHQIGVTRLTTELLWLSDKIKDPRRIDSLLVFTKAEKISIPQHLYNISYSLYCLLTGWIGTIRINLSGTNES